MQKLALVGWPFRRSDTIDRTSSQLSATGLTPVSVVASLTRSSRSDFSWARCQASRAVVAVNDSAIDASRAAQTSIGLVSGERIDGGPEPVEEFRQTARQLDVGAVHVVEGEGLVEEPLSLVGHGDPEQDPFQARPPRVALDTLELERAAMLAESKPQRTHASSTHSSRRNRSSSPNWNRRRTGSRPARSRTSVALIRAVARSRTSARTPITGLVWRRDRSAKRISSGSDRLVQLSFTSCAPNVA